MMKGLWAKIDFYESIANRVSCCIEKEDWQDSECFLEKKKLELFITLKVLKDFSIDFSQHEVPCTTRKPLNEEPCENFWHSKDTALFMDFESFYNDFIVNAYTKLGWEVIETQINDNLLNCICYEDEEGDDDTWYIHNERIKECLGDAYEEFSQEIHSMCNYMLESSIVVTHYYSLRNKRLGDFLRFSEDKPDVLETMLYIKIKSCIEKVQELIEICFDDVLHHKLLRDGSYGICYYFFYNQMDNEGVDSMNYIVTNLIFACILNLLLDKAYEIYSI